MTEDLGGRDMHHFLSLSMIIFFLIPVQVRDGYKDLPPPTFGHLTRAENELTPEHRQYLSEVSKRFDDLWEYFGEAEEQRRKLAVTKQVTGQVSAVKEDYSANLRRVERSAVGLYHKLAPMLPGVQRRKELEWKPAKDVGREPFRAEMEFIRGNIREAEHRFVKRSTEASVSGEGENVLIRLNWVAEMAQQLLRELGS